MPSLSLVLPAYNEAKRLPSTLRSVGLYISSGPCEQVEVILIDDGSTDGTAECAWAARDALEPVGATLRVMSNARNRGKGYSVRRGMREAQNDWILCSDADLSTPLAELEKLMSAVREGDHDIAIGSRGVDRSLIGVRQPLYREFAGRVFNFNMRALTGLEIADTQCGFKLFSRNAAWQIAGKQRIERFGFDVEQLYLARKLGFTIAEVPVQWNDAAGSSVGVVDGLKAFADIWTVKWNDLTGRYS